MRLLAVCWIAAGLVGLLLVLVGCRGLMPPFFFQEEVMGTHFSLTLYGVSPEEGVAIAGRAYHLVQELDARLSVYRSDSELSRLNRLAADRPVPVSQTLYQLLDKSVIYGRLTHGAFDVTVGPVVRLWRFYGSHGKLPPAKVLEQTLARCGYQAIELDPATRTVRFRKPGLEIDLGGIAKGYAVDRVLDALRRAGVRNALIDLGGNLYCLAAPPDESGWKVCVHHPLEANAQLGCLRIRDRALATSGQYMRYYTIGGRRYGHILDPRTGQPADNALQATIVSNSAERADILSTAAFVLGRQKFASIIGQLPEVEAIIVDRPSSESPFRLWITSGLLPRWQSVGGIQPQPLY